MVESLVLAGLTRVFLKDVGVVWKDLVSVGDSRKFKAEMPLNLPVRMEIEGRLFGGHSPGSTVSAIRCWCQPPAPSK